MKISYFGGAVFTDQQFILLCASAFLIVSTIAAVVIFLASKLRSKSSVNNQKQQIRLSRAAILGIILVGLLTLVFIVFPTLIKDNSSNNKQESCAKEAGYNSPADDSSTRGATAESQSAYRECLKR